MKLDREEFERLALEQIDTLYRLALRLTREPQRAEDLVQETYLRAIRGRKNFRLQSYGIRPWLVRIMHNTFYSQASRESRQPSAIEDEHLEAASADPQVSPIPLDSFEGMDERLVRAINDLPEQYQTVLLLWAVEDFSYKEIAHACAIPIGTVMSRLHRARQRLSERLADFARSEGIVKGDS